LPAGLAQAADKSWPTLRDALRTMEWNLAQKKAVAKTPADIAAIATDQAAWVKAVQDATALVGDGEQLNIDSFLPDQGEAKKLGLFALEQLYARDDLFNLLCIPPYKDTSDAGDENANVEASLIARAATYCEKRRAMLIVDPPTAWKDKNAAVAGFSADPDQIGARSRNAALFFPRVQMANPLHGNQLESFPPCGVVSGIFARTDAQRGVWKAPAGIDAALAGVAMMNIPLTDDENGDLNPLGINCLRSFPVYGRVLWGSRTLRGADAFADEYKYIPVRRTALYIEESLYRGLKWVVFEPNDEPLWSQVRLNVGAFMHNLFRQGAFQGRSPREAYFVKCDSESTTQNDINLGIVNIIVGFAPLKPAEFVVIKLQQITGQIEV
jgi:phage tail sheath protein FI